MEYKNPVPSLSITDPNFANGEEHYTYKKTIYFAFIDVLGFKKLFDDNRFIKKENPKKNSFSDKFKDVFEYYFELMDATYFLSKDCYAGQTSDSLYFYTERPDWMLQYMKVFLHLNLYAMSKDVFFRGGIAKGDLYIKDQHQFYGESVIYSYLLESEISKNPIIAIDDSTYKDIYEYGDTCDLIETENGRHYLKPFAPLLDGFSLNGIIDSNIELRDIDINSIKKNIDNNKNIFEYDAKNYPKYIFLENKYNETTCGE